MKKYYLLLVMMCSYFVHVYAQTAVTITSNYANVPSCTIPATGSFSLTGETNISQTNDSVQVFIAFGDGNDTTLMRVLTPQLTSSSFNLSGLNHTYITAGVFQVTYIVTAPTNVADTQVTYVMATASCGNLTGRLYFDNDNSCSYNTGDTSYSMLSVRLGYNGATLATVYTNAAGQYTLSAEPGYTYQLFNGGTSSYDPVLPLTCGTSQGMNVIMGTTTTQDLIVDDSTFIQASYMNYSGPAPTCVPVTLPVTFNAAVYGFAIGTDSVTCYLNFGDGSDSTFRAAILNNLYVNGIGNVTGNVPHTYTANGTYHMMCKITADDGTVDSLITYNAVQLLDTCGNISGRAYLDNNNDCIFNAGDSGYANLPVDVMQNNLFYTRVYTDAQGEYSVDLPPGTYEIEPGIVPLQYLGLTTNCPSSGSYTITVSSQTGYTADFGMNCPTSFDLTGNILLAIGIYPTQPGTLIPIVQNISCQPVSGTAQLILDPQVHFLGLNTMPPPGFTVNGDTLSWSFNYNNTFLNYSHISVIGDSTLQVGDSVCFQLNMLPSVGDINPTNNFITRCYEAFVAYDPNQKSVLPEGTGPGNDVLPGTVLDYTIQFQNTGNAPARDIFILDTLDASLDLSTMVVTGYSHYMETDLLPGNVIRFNFPEIWLPDSVNNEPLSHGFVSYRIGHLPNVPLGTTIENTANIYFDFNPPIVTNTTLNTIQVPSGVLEGNSASGFKLFPNPGKESFQVDFGKPVSGTVSLVDITGRIVMQKQLFAEQLIRVDAAAFPAGIYSFIYNDGENSRMQKVIITK